MKKLFIISLIILLACLASCSTSPKTKPLGNAEAHYNKALQSFSKRNFFEAIPSFEELKEKYPVSPYATLAELRLGDCHFLQDELELAIHYYENFKRLHPNNPNVPYSIYMTGKCYFEQLLSVDRDQTAALEAVEYFQFLVDIYPESPYSGKALCKISEAKKLIAEHETMVGLFYLANRDYKGATNRFIKLLKQYPKSINKDKIYYHIAQADFESGNVERGDKIVSLLANKYPESTYTPLAKMLAGEKSSEIEMLEKAGEKKNKWLFF